MTTKPGIRWHYNTFSGFYLKKKNIIFFLTVIFFFIITNIQFFPVLKTIKVDDTSYYTTAHGLRAGLNIYDEDTFDKKSEELFGKSVEVWPFTYPPLLGQFFIPLSYLNYPTFTSLLTIINILLAFSCILLTYQIIFGRDYKTSILLGFFSFIIVESLPFKLTILYGQAHFLIYLFILLSLLFYRQNKEWLSSLCLVFATMIKIFPAIYLLFFLINKKLKYVVFFIINSLSVIMISIFLFGLKPWINFLNYFFKIFLKGEKTLFFLHYYAYQNNKSLRSFLINLFDSWPIPKFTDAIYLLLILLLLFLCVSSLIKKRNNIMFAYSIITLLSIIISPMTWRHHFVNALFSIMILIYLSLKNGRMIALIVLLIMGYIIFYYPNWAGFPFSYAVLLAAFLLFLYNLRLKDLFNVYQ